MPSRQTHRNHWLIIITNDVQVYFFQVTWPESVKPRCYTVVAAQLASAAVLRLAGLVEE